MVSGEGSRDFIQRHRGFSERVGAQGADLFVVER
jgi:hypothetical protein